MAVPDTIRTRLTALEQKAVVSGGYRPVFTEEQRRTHDRYWTLFIKLKPIPAALRERYEALPQASAPPGSNEVIDAAWREWNEREAAGETPEQAYRRRWKGERNASG